MKVFEEAAKKRGEVTFADLEVGFPTRIIARDDQGSLVVTTMWDVIGDDAFSQPVEWVIVTPELEEAYPEIFL